MGPQTQVFHVDDIFTFLDVSQVSGGATRECWEYAYARFQLPLFVGESSREASLFSLRFEIFKHRILNDLQQNLDTVNRLMKLPAIGLEK